MQSFVRMHITDLAPFRLLVLGKLIRFFFNGPPSSPSVRPLFTSFAVSMMALSEIPHD